MKKPFIALLVIIALVFAALWILPAAIPFTQKATVNRPWQPFERNVVNLKQWQLWWPGKQVGDSLFEFNGKVFRINHVLLNGFEAMEAQDTLKRYAFHFVADQKLTTTITWAAMDNRLGGIFDKLQGYLQYVSFNRELKSWVAQVKQRFEDDERLYGASITKIKVPDLYMIAVKEQFNHMPTTEEIYGLIGELRNYIRQQNGKERNVPNMHIYQESPDLFQVMVAIPTETKLPATDRYLLREMIPGSLLLAEVKGGALKAMQTQESIGWYMRDYSKSSPAIPYQALVTDRMQEPDSSKWITRIYFPVFE